MKYVKASAMTLTGLFPSGAARVNSEMIAPALAPAPLDGSNGTSDPEPQASASPLLSRKEIQMAFSSLARQCQGRLRFGGKHKPVSYSPISHVYMIEPRHHGIPSTYPKMYMLHALLASTIP